MARSFRNRSVRKVSGDGNGVTAYRRPGDRKAWGSRKLAAAAGAPKIRNGPVKPRGPLLTGKEMADTYKRDP